MTISEIKEFSNRLDAAYLLLNDFKYYPISEKTGLSSTTIARVSKFLNGTLGGYRLVLNRLSDKHHSNPIKLEKGLS